MRGSSPGETGAGTTALPSSPRTVCLSRGDGGSFQSRQSIHKLRAPTASGGRREREGQRSGAQRQLGLQERPCPPLPRGCARGTGEGWDGVEIVQTGVSQTNIGRLWQLEQFRGEPRRGGDSIRGPELPRQHPPPPPPPPRGEGSKGTAARALPARRREVSI